MAMGVVGPFGVWADWDGMRGKNGRRGLWVGYKREKGGWDEQRDSGDLGKRVGD